MNYHAEGIRIALRVALIYLFFSAIWIILSDRVLEALISNPHLLSLFQTYKGFVFILVSAALLFFLLNNSLRSRGQAIQKQLERLGALRAIDAAITSSFDLQLVLDTLLDQTRSLLKVDAANVLKFDPDTQRLTCAASQGFYTDEICRSDFCLGEGLVGKVAEQRTFIEIADLQSAPISVKRRALIDKEKVVSYLGIALVARGS